MFTDWQEALEAEALPLNPNPADQLAAAARVTERRAHGKDDLRLLLDVLGLPTDEDTLTTLFPLLPDIEDTKTMTTDAFQGVAISMHTNGDSEEASREATGLSEKELSNCLPTMPADWCLSRPPPTPLGVTLVGAHVRQTVIAHRTARTVSRRPDARRLRSTRSDWAASVHPTSTILSRAGRDSHDAELHEDQRYSGHDLPRA